MTFRDRLRAFLYGSSASTHAQPERDPSVRYYDPEAPLPDR